jgi:hypothetical protein
MELLPFLAGAAAVFLLLGMVLLKSFSTSVAPTRS